MAKSARGAIERKFLETAEHDEQSTTKTQRQAVIVVHGMGEPTPMETLRGFVDAVWKDDPSLDLRNLETWTKPSPLTGSHETRLISTSGVASENNTRQQTDFYEFYWSDLMTGSKLADVTAWAYRVIIRQPWQVPRDVFHLWKMLLLVLVLTIVVGVARFAFGAKILDPLLAPFGITCLMILGWRCLRPFGARFALFVGGVLLLLANLYYHDITTKAVLAGLAVLIGFITNQFILPYFGDVARYVRRAPPNIAARQAIRTRGLKLISDLHSAKDDAGNPRYDRIVIVAHSLGSIVAYDLITHAFADRKEARDFVQSDASATAALTALEEAMFKADLSALQKAQRQLFGIAKRGEGEARWIVSDFITLGSPLGHASFLIAADEKDLNFRQMERELPRCPPVAEELWQHHQHRRRRLGIAMPLTAPIMRANSETGSKPHGIFYGASVGTVPTWRLHHAAPFAIVQWHNFYDRDYSENADLVDGDFISGRCVPHFGFGVADQQVRLTRPKNGLLEPRLITHTEYWSRAAKGEPEMQDYFGKLRKALDLRRHSFAQNTQPKAAKPSSSDAKPALLKNGRAAKKIQ